MTHPVVRDPAVVAPRVRAARAASDPTGGRIAGLGDRLVDRRASLGSVEWSAVYLGFLFYLFVITSYQIGGAQIAMAVALGGLLVQKATFRFPAFLACFVAFLVWSGLGIAQSRYPALVQEEVVTLGKLGLIMMAACNALRSRSQIRLFAAIWLATFVLYPLRGAYFNYFVADYALFGRASWGTNIYGNPNDLAALALLQISMAAGLLVSDPPGWIRRGAMIAMPLLVLLVFMTQSRAVFLGLSTFGLFAIVGSRRKLRILAVVGLMAMVVLMAAPENVWNRIAGLRNATDTENLAEVDPEGSAQERFQIWETSFEIIADHPLTGVGLATYPLENNRYAPLDGSRGTRRLGMKDTHNTYLNVAAELGFPGLVLFLGIILAVIVPVERARRMCRNDLPKLSQQLLFLELGLFGYMVASIFGSYSRLSFLYLQLTMMWALSVAAQDDLRTLTQLRQALDGKPARPQAAPRGSHQAGRTPVFTPRPATPSAS